MHCNCKQRRGWCVSFLWGFFYTKTRDNKFFVQLDAAAVDFLLATGQCLATAAIPSVALPGFQDATVGVQHTRVQLAPSLVSIVFGDTNANLRIADALCATFESLVDKDWRIGSEACGAVPRALLRRVESLLRTPALSLHRLAAGAPTVLVTLVLHQLSAQGEMPGFCRVCVCLVGAILDLFVLFLQGRRVKNVSKLVCFLLHLIQMHTNSLLCFARYQDDEAAARGVMGITLASEQGA